MKNKEFKCPLCGGLLDCWINKREDVYVGYGCYEERTVYYYQCLECHLSVEEGETQEEADKNAQELIESFPPIMRLNSGDKLLLEGAKDYFTVVSVELSKAEIHTDKGYCYVDDVVKWPWELEQEENQDGNNT